MFGLDKLTSRGNYDDLSVQNDGRKASAYDARLGNLKMAFFIRSVRNRFCAIIFNGNFFLRHSKRSNNKSERDT